MKQLAMPLGVSLLLTLAGTPSYADSRELRTIEAATATLQALSAIPLRCIPPSLIQDAKGVAIIPSVVKAGFVVGGRFGRGVVLVREPNGAWSNPVFVALVGAGVGGQLGIQSTDLVLIFKSRHSLDRILRGKSKLTLGGDVAIAAGPIGRDAEAATDAQLKAEIFSYSRSRGLFAGVSLEGAGILADAYANETFYGLRGGRPEDVLARQGVHIAAVETLKANLSAMSRPPAAPIFLIPSQTPPPPLVPPPQ
ncbi:MAG TPA: lipid-binding SYLF domain-containing protein [Gemmataceae bacterium]|nr:lipid-binding SYLF domain-containing protein [Gemmataceae bacterium]